MADRLIGAGLARGLAVTFATMTRRATTAEYPDKAPDLPARSRGVIALLEENCTVCMLCARECPDWCIYIDSHKEEVVVEGAARARQRNMLDRFAIDYSLCMYCGICVEVCPFDALFWSPQFEYSATDISELTHEQVRLREWMWSVPTPPALDPGAIDAKELAAPVRPKTARKGAGTEEPSPARRPTRRAAADDAPAAPAEPSPAVEASPAVKARARARARAAEREGSAAAPAVVSAADAAAAEDEPPWWPQQARGGEADGPDPREGKARHRPTPPHRRRRMLDEDPGS